MMVATVLAACEEFGFSQECLDAIEQKGIKAQNPRFVSGTDLGTFFNADGNYYNFVTLIFFFAGGILAFYIISAGIGFMTSRGNPQGIANNKQKIINAIAGLLLLFSAYWIVQLVGTVLGLEGITETFQ